MTRKKPVTLEQVFQVMAKHDFNVKEASQELQINKSRIYNMKSKHKAEWQALLDEHNQKEENEMNKEPTLRKVSSKKFKPVPSVKSALAEKHVGVTRKISDEDLSKSASEALKALGENARKAVKAADKITSRDSVPKQNSLSKDLYAENIELDKKVKTLTEYNEELADAVKRANEEKNAIGVEHNSLIDDFNEAKALIKTLRDQIQRTQTLRAQDNIQPLEVEETVYAVKLGKVFVTPDMRLYGHHSAAQFKDIENAKQIKDEVGGTLYKSVLMPVGDDSSE